MSTTVVKQYFFYEIRSMWMPVKIAMIVNNYLIFMLLDQSVVDTWKAEGWNVSLWVYNLAIHSPIIFNVVNVVLTLFSWWVISYILSIILEKKS